MNNSYDLITVIKYYYLFVATTYMSRVNLIISIKIFYFIGICFIHLLHIYAKAGVNIFTNASSICLDYEIILLAA